jgi:hypothetical protein
MVAKLKLVLSKFVKWVYDPQFTAPLNPEEAKLSDFQDSNGTPPQVEQSPLLVLSAHTVPPHQPSV